MAETSDVAGQVVSAGIDLTKELSELVLRLGTSAGAKVAQVIWKGVAVQFIGNHAWNAAKAVYCAIRNGQVTMTQLDKMSHNSRATIDFSGFQKDNGSLGRFLDYLHKMRISYALSEFEDITYVIIDQKDITAASPYLKQLGWESVVKPDGSLELPTDKEEQNTDFSFADYEASRKDIIKNQQAPAQTIVSERISENLPEADVDRASVKTKIKDIKDNEMLKGKTGSKQLVKNRPYAEKQIHSPKGGK